MHLAARPATIGSRTAIYHSYSPGDAFMNHTTPATPSESSAIGTVGRTAAGAAAGAAAGSFVGPVGAAVGAVVGGALGATAPDIAKRMPKSAKAVKRSLGGSKKSSPAPKKKTAKSSAKKAPAKKAPAKKTATAKKSAKKKTAKPATKAAAKKKKKK
jgi:phage tail tape-measure protein